MAKKKSLWLPVLRQCIFFFSSTDLLSTFSVVLEIECIDWELRIPSRLREGKDVPGISF
jgi:hypothetical protein